jgi:DNA polymerase V
MIGGIDISKIERRLTLRLVGSVRAGFPSPAGDYIESEIDLAEILVPHPSSTFFVRVQGDSMEGACIPDGALLIVDRSLKAVSGKIIVAIVNGEFTIKRLVKTPRSWVLHPENSAYRPIQLNEEMTFEVWGVVTKIILEPK